MDNAKLSPAIRLQSLGMSVAKTQFNALEINEANYANNISTRRHSHDLWPITDLISWYMKSEITHRCRCKDMTEVGISKRYMLAQASCHIQ